MSRRSPFYIPEWGNTYSWSGGGSVLHRNLLMLASSYPRLVSRGTGNMAIVDRNIVPMQLLLRGFVYMPQSAWPWLRGPGLMADELVRWSAIRLGTWVAERRAQVSLPISESIPCRSREASVLHNVLDADFEASCPAHLPQREHGHVLAVGSFVSYRNYEVLLRAFFGLLENSPKNWRLTLAGPVVSQRYLRRILAMVSMSRYARSVGVKARRLGRAEVVQMLAESDTVVFPSTVEASPVTPLEAAAVGSRVVASQIPGHVGVAKQYELGFALFQPADTNTLKQLLLSNGDAAVDEGHPIMSASGRSQLRDEWLARVAQMLHELPTGDWGS